MKKINIKIILSLISAFLFLSLFVACSSDNKENGSGGGTAEGTLVKPSYDRTSMLRNPLNGWVMYASRNARESYWDTEYYVPDIGETVKAIDYVSACYIRTSWSSLNPSEGVYTWRDPNTQLGNLIQGAQKRGVPIAFRIVVDGRDQGMNTPQFVFDAGASYYLENPSYPTRITPFPQDPIFQEHYAKFIETLAEDFNDPDRTAFIDAYGLGKWGEAHNVIYEEPHNATPESTERLKLEVFEWVTDLYTRCFDKVPLVINYHRLVGHPSSWAGSANKNTNMLLTSAINKGYSLRSDAFGMTDYYGGWEKQFAASWLYKCPIIMEGGWITAPDHPHQPWKDSSGRYREGHPEDVRQGEFDDSQAAHVNMMDFRAGYETETWFTLCFGLVQRFISEGGYRLYPDQVYLPESVGKGNNVTITHRWRNMGWGYFPNNIKQWNYKYKVAFALLDADGQPKQVLVDKDSEPSEWLRGKPASYKFKTKVDVPAGKYKWAVAIVDTTKDNKPGIKLALSNKISDTGWIELLDVNVR